MIYIHTWYTNIDSTIIPLFTMICPCPEINNHMYRHQGARDPYACMLGQKACGSFVCKPFVHTCKSHVGHVPLPLPPFATRYWIWVFCCVGVALGLDLERSSSEQVYFDYLLTEYLMNTCSVSARQPLRVLVMTNRTTFAMCSATTLPRCYWHQIIHTCCKIGNPASIPEDGTTDVWRIIPTHSVVCIDTMDSSLIKAWSLDPWQGPSVRIRTLALQRTGSG